MTTSLPPDPQRGPWDLGADGARASYRGALRELDDEVVAIAQDLAAASRRILSELSAPDRSAPATARGEDADRRHWCRQLEDRCFVLIAREGPVAADLREVVAVTRAVTDLERWSRLLVHVADATVAADPARLPDPVRSSVDALAAAALRILVGGVDAWRSRDGLAVNELRTLDDDVDRLQEELLSALYAGDHAVVEVVPVALLARYLERLADHGVALAGHISWAVTGDRVGIAR